MNVATTIIASPYPGLRPFRQEEAELFFGRERQTNEMLTRLEDHADFRFLAVIGASGSGKSSLVKAGLLPALSQGFLLGAPEDWKFVTARPGDAPLRSLANAWVDTFHPLADQRDAADSERYHFALAQLRAGPLGLVRALRGEKETKKRAVLILIDQFEEMFRFRREQDSVRTNRPVEPSVNSGPTEWLDVTIATGTSPTTDTTLVLEQQRNEAAAFVELLLATARQTEVPIYVVITMRSDFLGDCDAFLGLPEAISRSQYLTPRMTRSQLSEAITRPLELPQFGASVEPTLVTRILNDVGTDPDQLPLIQHALMRTWRAAVARSQEEGKSSVQLSSSDYDKSGGVSRALSKDANEALDELRRMQRSESLVRMAEMLFRSLAHQSEAGQLVRRPVQVREVLGVVSDQPTPQDCEDLNQVLTTFEGSGRHFLMRTSTDSESAAELPLLAVESNTPHFQPTDFIDISHESLLRQWDQVQRWFMHETEAARQYRRLVEAVQAKESRLTGEALDRALDWRGTLRTPTWAMRYDHAQTPKESLLPQCLELIEASKRLRDSDEAEAKFGRQWRVLRNAIVAFVLLMLVWNRDRLEIERVNVPLAKTTVIALSSDEFVVFLDDKDFRDLKKQLEQESRLDSSYRRKWQSTFSGETEEGLIEKLEKVEESGELKELNSRYEAHVSVALAKYVSSVQPKFQKSLLDKLDPTVQETVKQAKLVYVGPVNINSAKYVEHQPALIDWLCRSRNEAQSIKQPRWRFVLRYSPVLEPIGNAFLIAVHLLGYFTIAFGARKIYHKIAFRRVGSVADLTAKYSPWVNRWRIVVLGTEKLLIRFRKRRWQRIFVGLSLIIGLFMLSMGCFLVKNEAAFGGFLLATFGVVLILLLPPDVILNHRWRARLKVAQSISLKLVAFFFFTLSCIIFFSGYEFISESRGWWLSASSFFSGVIGILGMKRCMLTPREVLAVGRDRAPVLYLRSSEDRKRRQLESWCQWVGGVFWYQDEPTLRHIFSELGPFVPLAPGLGLTHSSSARTGVSEGDHEPEATQLIRKSALVILQIDATLTDDFLSELRQRVPTLRHDQVLVYFSQQFESERANTAYENLKRQTRHVFPCDLPASVDTNCFVEFEEDWQPLVFGAINKPGFSWRTLIPLLGAKFEMRRSVTKALNPFFERRRLVNSQIKLYSDFAIGLAAFPLFGLLPAGFMMLRNLWCTGRRWLPGIRLALQFGGFVGLFAASLAASAWFESNSSLPWEVVETFVGTTIFMVIFGFPIATYWLWRRLSGTKIRQHIAFGGALQPRWKTFLVLVAGLLPVFGWYWHVSQWDREREMMWKMEMRRMREMERMMERERMRERETAACNDLGPNVANELLAPEGSIVTLKQDTVYLRFAPWTSGNYRFDLKRSKDQETDVDPFIAIIRVKDCKEIGQNDDTDGLDSQLSLDLEARDYLIGVKSISQEGKATLSVTQTSSGVGPPP